MFCFCRCRVSCLAFSVGLISLLILLLSGLLVAMSILWMDDEITWKIWGDYGSTIPNEQRKIFLADAGLLFLAAF